MLGDEEWVIEGAAVRVSLICFSSVPIATTRRAERHEDQRGPDRARLAGIDLTRAARLPENDGCFSRRDLNGPFEVEGGLAREWLSEPINPNGRANSDVVKPN